MGLGGWAACAGAALWVSGTWFGGARGREVGVVCRFEGLEGPCWFFSGLGGGKFLY